MLPRAPGRRKQASGLLTGRQSARPTTKDPT